MAKEGVITHLRKQGKVVLRPSVIRGGLATADLVEWVKLSDLKEVVRAHQPKTRINILNDTSDTLTVRRPPTTHTIQPQKMTVEIIEGDEVFLKIWDNNVILLSKTRLGGVEP